MLLLFCLSKTKMNKHNFRVSKDIKMGAEAMMSLSKVTQSSITYPTEPRLVMMEPPSNPMVYRVLRKEVAGFEMKVLE
jgi:hypothetical protein